jgi:hypothetical protein
MALKVVKAYRVQSDLKESLAIKELPVLRAIKVPKAK